MEKLDLTNQIYDPARLATMVLDDPSLLQELLEGVTPDPKPEARRGNCSKALLWLAEHNPQTLLPHWGHFADLLLSDNGYSIYVALYVVASLSGLVSEEEFRTAYPDILHVLHDKRTMVAGHSALNAGKIALARPEVSDDVIEHLLQVKTGLVSAYVIEALDSLYDHAQNKPAILAYVRSQAGSNSPKSRKLAAVFLKRHSAV
jgi:hypothetical protein